MGSDDAVLIPQSAEHLRKMMVVTVTLFRCVWLTVSKAMNEIMFLRTWGMTDTTATFSVEAGFQVYKQTHNCTFGGEI